MKEIGGIKLTEEDEENLRSVDTEEKFMYFFEFACKVSKKWALDGLPGNHVILPVHDDGSWHVLSFDDLMDNAIKLDEIINSEHDEDERERFCKHHVYKALGLGFIGMGVQGYIESGEAWMIESSTADSSHIYEKYGSIEKTPGRIETLFVNGRWREKALRRTWQIVRMGDEVFLKNERTEHGCQLGGNVALMDKAVVENTREK